MKKCNSIKSDTNRLGEIRNEQRIRRLGTREPICRDCGEDNPIALTGTHPHILCYECQAKKQRRSATELHHFAGRHNDCVVVPIPGNEHRILSDMQKDWSKNMLQNKNNSPLIKAAAAIQGFLDIVKLLIERILGWIPAFLESIDHFLTQHFGAIWWESETFQGAE